MRRPTSTTSSSSFSWWSSAIITRFLSSTQTSPNQLKMQRRYTTRYCRMVRRSMKGFRSPRSCSIWRLFPKMRLMTSLILIVLRKNGRSSLGVARWGPKLTQRELWKMNTPLWWKISSETENTPSPTSSFCRHWDCFQHPSKGSLLENETRSRRWSWTTSLRANLSSKKETP